jgi:sulfatase modifying factor 1
MMSRKHDILIFLAILVFFPLSICPLYAGDITTILTQIENNMVRIPEGEFIMGGNETADETPPHKVYLDAFYIGKYEVTFEEYEAFCHDSGHSIPVDPRYGAQPDPSMLGPTLPVMNVSRDEAERFCQWLSKNTGKKFRLPTEAEWEKAARGGLEKKTYPWGNEPPAEEEVFRANFGPGLDHFVWKKDGYEYSAPVATYPPNGYGLYDMAGNLWEWCYDGYERTYYRDSPYKNPQGPQPRGNPKGIIRGGSYGSASKHLRCAKRYAIHSGNRDCLVGFRIARDAH